MSFKEKLLASIQKIDEDGKQNTPNKKSNMKKTPFIINVDLQRVQYSIRLLKQYYKKYYTNSPKTLAERAERALIKS
jgi:hypothetical protein